MTGLTVRLVTIALVGAGAVGTGARVVQREAASPSSQPAQPAVTLPDYDRWKTELSNWGRWGQDDTLGALNLVTPSKRRQAAALVRDGVTVSLAADADFRKGAGPGAVAPYELVVTSRGPTGAGDRMNIAYHGNAVTHLDAFGHRFFGGRMYNGFSWEELTKPDSAKHESVYDVRNGVLTRGVLMDIARLKGVEYLEPGTRIYVEDLEAWEKKAKVKVSSGDALLVRTGRWQFEKQNGGPARTFAGLDPSVIPWLKKRDIVLIGGEDSQDATPPLPGLPPLAVHDFCLVALGVHTLDNANLDALAAAAAMRNRWEFMLVVAPLAVPGATGSPFNPIAAF
jgi:kynurenine formamidase